VQIAFLPFRAPELMPCEDLWRQLKAVVAESSVYANITELARRAVAWLDATPGRPATRSGRHVLQIRMATDLEMRERLKKGIF
jgi:hypothetical protein